MKIALATIFLLAAAAKLAGQQQMVEEFGVLGLGQQFRFFTGLVEVTGAALLLWARTAFSGALLLLAVCACALVAQVGPLQGDAAHVLVLVVLAWLVPAAGSGRS